MAEQHSDKMGDKASHNDHPKSDEAIHEGDKGGEWLRDQVGEDHNLSGSSTFRTLPDQPGTGSNKDSKSTDSNDRQSKR